MQIDLDGGLIGMRYPTEVNLVGDPILVSNAMGYFTARVNYPGPGSLRAIWNPSLPVPSLPQSVG